MKIRKIDIFAFDISADSERQWDQVNRITQRKNAPRFIQSFGMLKELALWRARVIKHQVACRLRKCLNIVQERFDYPSLDDA